MNVKGILALMAAITIAASLIPTAAAGIPVPKQAVLSVVADGAGAAGDVSAAFTGDVTTVGHQVEEAVTVVAASTGDTLVGDGESIATPENQVLAIYSIVDGSVDVAGERSQAYAANSATTLAGASGLVGAGTMATLQAGIDGAAGASTQAENTLDTQVDLFGATTQGAAEDFGGVQRVLVQGGFSTYNAHAAPAACVVAGIAANLAGAVSAQQSCAALIL